MEFRKIKANNPIIQEMLDNPSDDGIEDVTFGKGLTLTTEYYPINKETGEMGEHPVYTQTQRIPYPSPKELLTDQGNQTIYQQTSFAPQPQYQSQMQYTQYAPNTMYTNTGYGHNPYLQPQPKRTYYGQNTPNMSYYQQPVQYQAQPQYQMVQPQPQYQNVQYYQSQYSNPQYYQQPMQNTYYQAQPRYQNNARVVYYDNQYINLDTLDDETRINLEGAIVNGVSYEEQVRTESEIYKMLSRAVSKAIGRSEEEAKRCEEHFNVVDRIEQLKEQEFERKCRRINNRVNIKASIVYKGEVVYSGESFDSPDYAGDRMQDNVERCEQIIKRDAIMKENREMAFITMHNSAIERKYDHTDMLEFFNGGGASEVTQQIFMQRLKTAKSRLVGSVYDKDNFRTRLIKNNSRMSPYKEKQVKKLVGRYGYHPNGMPISPQHDPMLSDCFAYNLETGVLEVTMPDYMQRAFDRARNKFMTSVDKSQ